MKKYKLLMFLITLSLVIILYSILLIPIITKTSDIEFDSVSIVLLVLYGYLILFLPPSFIYYFYAKLYVRHGYDIFAEPLGCFEIFFCSIPYTFYFYSNDEWYKKRIEYKDNKNKKE